MNQQFSPADVNQTKSLAWMSYLGVLFFVPLLVYPQSPYTKFHVNQGLVLFIIGVAGGILQKVFHFIPLVRILGSLALGAVGIFTLVLSIMGIIYAAQGQARELPLVGQIHIIK
ncbi:hypothetical protein [Bittarella massiliensis (ex Durand et al. 2017)]|uniref:hypothetical protein n=1 Tax=Bittarella massiliensis (ex Durand et al. 2017) TaxID=1720313 RepID=UPI001AA0FA2C|nr:hypothetical protein [Bittarella massiliensis (ex Durand et al. 2017)]MBO1679047.1 hypothetical protein [Bittarella massiliensis (ex Durand et al. 2017)]